MRIRLLGLPRGRWLALGRVVRAHGIRGEVKCIPYSGRPADFSGRSHLTLLGPDGSSGEEFEVLRSQGAAELATLALAGLVDRSMAEALRGRELAVPLDSLPPPEAGVMYWHEIEGNPVLTEEGEWLGRVSALLANPGHDLLVVDGPAGELLIPAVDEMLVGMSADGESLVVSLPPGLRELNG